MQESRNNPDPLSICPAGQDERSPKWLTIQQVAEQLGVSRDTVARWISTGQLQAVDVSPHARKGSHRASWRIHFQSLAVFLESRASAAPMELRERPNRQAPGVIEFIK